MTNRRGLPSVPLSFEQPALLIEHEVEGAIVPQRPTDGYVNATRLCQQAGKLFGDYRRLTQTRAFLEALEADMGIPITALIQVIRGGNETLSQGTWVHPYVAVNLGQWLSPEFAVQVGKWVFDWMQSRVNPFMPVHVRRYLMNRAKIPPTHFSMLNEIYLNLLAPLEENGVVLPDNMMPDISTGRMFSGELRRLGIDVTSFQTYEHEFVDGSRPIVYARLYPIEYLPAFRQYFFETWLPTRAEAYFQERFQRALPYLPHIQQLPPA